MAPSLLAPIPLTHCRVSPPSRYGVALVGKWGRILMALHRSLLSLSPTSLLWCVALVGKWGRVLMASIAHSRDICHWFLEICKPRGSHVLSLSARTEFKSKTVIPNQWEERIDAESMKLYCHIIRFGLTDINWNSPNKKKRNHRKNIRYRCSHKLYLCISMDVSIHGLPH